MGHLLFIGGIGMQEVLLIALVVSVAVVRITRRAKECV